MSGVALKINTIPTLHISPICSLYYSFSSIEKPSLQNLTVQNRSKLRDKNYHNLYSSCTWVFLSHALLSTYTLLRINMWQKLENNLYGKPVMVTGAVRVRKSTDISTLFRLLKTDRVVLKSLRRSSFKKGTVLYQSTLFLHCSAVLIYRSCSMKYLAEAKHMHPLNSGWRRKCIFPPSSGMKERAEYHWK